MEKVNVEPKKAQAQKVETPGLPGVLRSPASQCQQCHPLRPRRRPCAHPHHEVGGFILRRSSRL